MFPTIGPYMIYKSGQRYKEATKSENNELPETKTSSVSGGTIGPL
jgi:hypothetical protein